MSEKTYLVPLYMRRKQSNSNLFRYGNQFKLFATLNGWQETTRKLKFHLRLANDCGKHEFSNDQALAVIQKITAQKRKLTLYICFSAMKSLENSNCSYIEHA